MRWNGINGVKRTLRHGLVVGKVFKFDFLVVQKICYFKLSDFPKHNLLLPEEILKFLGILTGTDFTILQLFFSFREELALKIGLTEARIQVIIAHIRRPRCRVLIYCNFYDLCNKLWFQYKDLSVIRARNRLQQLRIPLPFLEPLAERLCGRHFNW